MYAGSDVESFTETWPRAFQVICNCSAHYGSYTRSKDNERSTKCMVHVCVCRHRKQISKAVEAKMNDCKMNDITE